MPPIPDRTARPLTIDRAAASIPYTQARARVKDFHALGATDVTHLIQGGANVRVVKKLARHLAPVITIARYPKAEDADQSAALDRLSGRDGTPVRQESEGHDGP